MNEKTNIQPETQVSARTIEDFKHATLVVSVGLNLTIFLVWVLAHAGAGTI